MRHEAIAIRPARGWAGLLDRRFLALVAATWVVAAALIVALSWNAILHRDYGDPDDLMRLVEVRDWIDGQGFRDVTQYRMNPPAGGPMHWSRLVDMPIAASILALRPLLGYEPAQTVTAVVVPMLLLLGVMFLVGIVTRRLAGPVAGLVAVASTIMTFGVLNQFLPLRVDHHGWQILLSLVAAAASLMRPSRRAGAIAGIALAFALQISLETLPFAVVYGTVLAVVWALSPTSPNGDRMRAFAATLFGVEAGLTWVLRDDLTGYCDAVSTPHLVAFGVAAIGLALLRSFGPATRSGRFAALAVVAGAGGAAFRAIPPHCGVDAFPMLEPIVRADWYRRVNEGMPVWHQSGIMAAAAIVYPIVSLACAAAALRGMRGADRSRWATYAVLLAGATAVAVLVERAGCLASLLAAPPVAWATVRVVRYVQASRRAVVRVCGTVLVVVGLNPMAAVIAVAAIPAMRDRDVAAGPSARRCGNASALRALNAFPKGIVFAPMNTGPAILLDTHHSIVASGYHRNHAAIADEITAFLGDDATAHRILDRHRVRYVQFCADQSETAFYRQEAPNGFAAHLAANRAPTWLRPLDGPGHAIRVWEMTD